MPIYPAIVKMLAFSALMLCTAAEAAPKKGTSPSEIQIAKDTLAAQLTDPESARFRSIVLDKSGAVCGEFNSKNRAGGYTGFRRFLVFGQHVLIDDRDQEQYSLRWPALCTGQAAPQM